MGIIKKNFLLLLLSFLFICVLIFYNVYALQLEDSFIAEKTANNFLMTDLICDLAAQGGCRDTLIDSVSNIDMSSNNGMYGAAFNADFEPISERTLRFPVSQYNPLNDPDFKRDVRLQNRGKATVMLEQTSEAPKHPINLYFRWVYKDTPDAVLVIVGVSKYSLETDVEEWLKVGAWLIAAAFTITGVCSVTIMLKRKKKEGVSHE